MQLYEWRQSPGKELTPGELCDVVEQDYHLAITASATIIGQFLSKNPDLPDLPVAASELVHLLFSKLNDELKHLLLKESGIIFPCIRNCKKGPQALCVKDTMVEVIRGRQSVVTALLQRMRQLLNNFVTTPQHNPEWKTCINAFFLLETAVFQWIHVEQNLLYPAVQQIQKTKK
jgi:iron-sulfur cluster repair protein YtfE (RIC family)